MGCTVTKVPNKEVSKHTISTNESYKEDSYRHSIKSCQQNINVKNEENIQLFRNLSTLQFS